MLIASKLKASQNKSIFIPYKIKEPASNYTWLLFWTLQAADVWSTYKGMKYDCVYEQNPLLPKVPHLDRLLIHKIVFLHPFVFFQSENLLSEEDMLIPNLMGTYVIHNNLRVIDRAERNCSKR